MPYATELETILQDVQASSFKSEADRIRVRDALFEALRRVQSPWDIVWDHCWVGGVTNATVKTLIDVGLFTKWAEAGGKASTSSQLARLVGADSLLIRRLMRQIAGQCLVTEVAEDTYLPTAFAQALASDLALPSCYGSFSQDLQQPCLANFPAFAAESGYQNPSDVNNCNFQHWKGSGANQFAYIGGNPVLSKHFNDAMECHSRYNLTAWVEVYPTDSIVADQKDGRALVVDIGGGKGHDLEKFRAKHSAVPAGSLILHDLPATLDGVTPTKPACVVYPHDFFQPEPVTGAKVYFMHNVLHDWPDDAASSILKNVVGAMEKGYSKLLIHESLVSARKPLARVTTSDIVMMAVVAAKERTEAEWRDLITGAGLSVVKIWRPAEAVESVIEAELA